MAAILSVTIQNVRYSNVSSIWMFGIRIPTVLFNLEPRQKSNWWKVTCKPSSMQRIDRCHSSCDAVTLDVNIALRRHRVDINVGNSPMSITLVYDVITDFHVPVWSRFGSWVEHVWEKEALCGDRRVHCCKLLSLLLCDSLGGGGYSRNAPYTYKVLYLFKCNESKWAAFWSFETVLS